MKKIILFALFTLVSLVTSAQNNTYNMVIELANGTKITLGPNDVRNISFNEGQLVISGEDITTMMNNVKLKIDSLAWVTQELSDKFKILEDRSYMLDEYITRQDVQNIINQYLTNKQYITRQDVTEIINNFLKEYYTKTEVENLLKNYITNEYLTKNFYTKEEVMNIINNLPQDDLTDLLNRIAALEGKDVYTKSEVDALLNELLNR